MWMYQLGMSSKLHYNPPKERRNKNKKGICFDGDSTAFESDTIASSDVSHVLLRVSLWMMNLQYSNYLTIATESHKMFRYSITFNDVGKWSWPLIIFRNWFIPRREILHTPFSTLILLQEENNKFTHHCSIPCPSEVGPEAISLYCNLQKSQMPKGAEWVPVLPGSVCEQRPNLNAAWPEDFLREQSHSEFSKETHSAFF